MNESKRNFGKICGVVVWSISIIVLQAALWLCWLFVMVQWVPLLERILIVREMELPVVTQQLITLSRYTASYWYLLVLFGLPLAIVESAILITSRVKQRPALTALSYASVTAGTLLPLFLLFHSILISAVTLNITAREIASSTVDRQAATEYHAND